MNNIHLFSSQRLLKKVLEDPTLPQRIQALDGVGLAHLVNELGLEDSGEILGLATAEQLQGAMDEDIWHQRVPGGDEVFDPERFGLWLEVLLELGSSKLAERLAELDQEFLTMAFAQMLWVVRFDDLHRMISRQEALEKVVDSSHYHEIEDFFLFSRRSRFWDSILSVIIALDRDHHSLLRTILDSCSYLTLEAVQEQEGLHAVLSSEDQLVSDAAFEREKRREGLGYVNPADARAFLKLAEGPKDREDHVSPRRLRMRRQELKSGSGSRKPELTVATKLPIDHEKYRRVRALLFRTPEGSELYLEELNYLANVLVSGGSVGGRSYRPGEAIQVVLETCERGLAREETLLSLLDAFRLAWAK